MDLKAGVSECDYSIAWQKVGNLSSGARVGWQLQSVIVCGRENSLPAPLCSLSLFEAPSERLLLPSGRGLTLPVPIKTRQTGLYHQTPSAEYGR